jgi:signal transduction histidine kinase
MISTIWGKLSSKLRFSITFRITSVYAFIVTLALLLLNIGILFGGSAYILKSEGDDLQRDFLLISAYMNDSKEIPSEQISQLAALSNTTIAIFDDNQKLLFTTDENPNSAVFIDKYNNRNIIIEPGNNSQILIADISRPYSDIPREFFNEYGFALVLNENILRGKDRNHIQIIDKLSEVTAYAGIFIFTLIALDLFFIILIMLIGSAASKRLLKPVKVMTDTVKNISVSQLDTRLDVSGSKNELKDLAKTFNNMLDGIQLAYERQNQFVSDASHELRTPISVVQGYANLLDRWGKSDSQILEESIAAIKTESENMKELIEKLLFLARGDKGTQKLEREDFYINGLIDEIIKETVLIDDTHQVTCVRSESIHVNADRGLLKEAIRVFMDNSVKYTPAGGKIKLECYLENHSAVITIEDTGIGISAKDLPHIFDRFYRADKSRTKQTGGTGLGMAIAKWIILKHDGTIKVQSQLNSGTKIFITLPK